MNGPDEQKQPPSGSSNIWKQLLAVVFAGILLWLSFRGADFGLIWKYAQASKPQFLLIVFVSAIISHILRAWRWIYLLKPLSDKPVSLWNSFCAVIIGYAVNIAVPRGGEVARLISISKSEKLPWMGVLPTMLIDRFLDLVMLGSLFGMMLTLLPKQILDSHREFIPGGVAITACSLVGLFMLPFMGKLITWFLEKPTIKEKLPAKIVTALEDLAQKFDIGTKSLTDPKAYPAIVLLSLAIWFFYWANFYAMVWAFDLQARVSPLQSLVVFTVGSLGVLVPTPGSVGGYHYLVSQALEYTCGLDHAQSLAFATVLHFLCFIVAICIPAAICWLWQQSRPAAAKSTPN